ncbi:hypothetical protein ACOMHN_042807 [Nucella lapillus]
MGLLPAPPPRAGGEVGEGATIRTPPRLIDTGLPTLIRALGSRHPAADGARILSRVHKPPPVFELPGQTSSTRYTVRRGQAAAAVSLVWNFGQF